MAAIIMQCRNCEAEIQAAPDTTIELTCPQCKRLIPLRIDESIISQGIVKSCAACGHDRLYIQKDFNRNLGLAIVIAGAAVSVLFFAFGHALYAMLTLFITALVDGLVYALVGSVTVCYVCHTIYRGFAKNPDHGPFDLKDLEKFGGRDPRF